MILPPNSPVFHSSEADAEIAEGWYVGTFDASGTLTTDGMRRVYRAAVWVSANSQSEVRLTEESDGALTDFELIALANKNAVRTDLEIGNGKIIVTDWVE